MQTSQTSSSEPTPPANTQTTTPPPVEEEEYELELPENSGLSEKDLDEVAALAEKYNLGKEEAQEILNQRASVYGSAQEKFKSEQVARAKAEQAELLAHEHFKTEEARNKSLDLINRAVQAIGNPELVKVLQGPAGNNLQIALAFRNLGELMGDDSFAKGTGQPTPTKNTESSVLETMYPSFFKK